MFTFPFRYLMVAFLLCMSCQHVLATHIVGGEVTYKFLGSVPGGNSYRVHLTIYEDCLNGSTGAIAADTLAYLTVDDGAGQFVSFDSVYSVPPIIVPANFSNLCISNIPAICLQKRDYVLDLVLPPNATGYSVTYQRCCRNAAIVNIQQPANIGATYYCTIPPLSMAGSNNSAVFKNFPPQIICVNTPLIYDHSATDADGDSLSYELCNSLMCQNGANIDRLPFVPPYEDVAYVAPYTYAMPMDSYPQISIDPKTGLLAGTPNRMGRYLITVCCNEWRHGIMINTVKREFQFVVTNCSKTVEANIPLLAPYPNTFEQNCKDHTIQFINTSKGGFQWLWDFGVAGVPRDTSFQPIFVYPDTGTYTVKLVVNPGQTCADSIIRLVRIYPVFRARFATTDTQCAGAPVYFTDQTISTAKPITKWKWYFGDGDSLLEENPGHSYAHAGAYAVMLANQNIKGCTDTALRQVLVDNFSPFAGNDTTVVKGSFVQFNATGGFKYLWTPTMYLESSDIYNPTGYYPDTGQFDYTVRIISPYGCVGYDTIQVTVVNQAAFQVPTAFTPNGDGHNDIFKPYAIGYKSLNYFRVFNRWGEEVYFSTSFDAGWDGTYHRKPADTGTYFWEISYTDRFGKDGTMKGDVALIR